MSDPYDMKYIRIEKNPEPDLASSVLKAYDLGREKGFSEGYQAGLQYAITKVKETREHMGGNKHE